MTCVFIFFLLSLVSVFMGHFLHVLCTLFRFILFLFFLHFDQCLTLRFLPCCATLLSSYFHNLLTLVRQKKMCVLGFASGLYVVTNVARGTHARAAFLPPHRATRPTLFPAYYRNDIVRWWWWLWRVASWWWQPLTYWPLTHQWWLTLHSYACQVTVLCDGVWWTADCSWQTVTDHLTPTHYLTPTFKPLIWHARRWWWWWRWWLVTADRLLPGERYARLYAAVPAFYLPYYAIRQRMVPHYRPALHYPTVSGGSVTLSRW